MNNAVVEDLPQVPPGAPPIRLLAIPPEVLRACPLEMDLSHIVTLGERLRTATGEVSRDHIWLSVRLDDR
jgi:hypothetical protein